MLNTHAQPFIQATNTRFDDDYLWYIFTYSSTLLITLLLLLLCLFFTKIQLFLFLYRISFSLLFPFSFFS